MEFEQFSITSFLKYAVEAGASDEHLKVGNVPFVRKNGFIEKTNYAPLTRQDLDDAILEITPTSIRDDILTMCDVDFMFEIRGCSKFRINYNRQLGLPALTIRNIPYQIPTLADLNLPDILSSIAKHSNGIVLITGPTGSGKSTTIASIIDKIITDSAKHIITIEDPVEYVFTCKNSIVSQRQIGIDTADFATGIKYALRQDPDIIFIGEIRDKETMAASLKAAETGHLVFATLHTNDVVQTLNRIVNIFNESDRDVVRKQVAEALRATVAQKLVYSKKNDKRYPACEILVITPAVKDYIIRNNTEAIYDLIEETNYDSMITLNASLAKLVSKGLISAEEALEQSNDRNDLEKLLRGVYTGTRANYE